MNIIVPVNDTDKQLKRHILSLILVRVCLFTLLTGIILFFHFHGTGIVHANIFLTITFLAGIVAFSVGSVFYIRKGTDSLRRFGVIQLLADISFTGLLVYGTGCSQSIFTPIFILPVITGGLILYKIGGLIPAAAATIVYGIVLTMEHFGLVPPYSEHTVYRPPDDPLVATNLFAVYGITFFVIALLSSQLAGRLRRTEKELSKTVLEFDRLSILYKQIFDDISTGIITTDEHNIITSYNNAARRITGFPEQEVLGTHFHTCFPGIILAGDKERNVCNLLRNDSTTIRVGYSFSRLGMPAVEQKESDGAYWKVVTLQDISKIESMERQVREAEKMAAIGKLSASIAHDFRNPLAAISGSSQILAMDNEGGQDINGETAKPLLNIILRECGRMAKTITDFLQFSKPEELDKQWFDLGRLVSEVIEEKIPASERNNPEQVIQNIQLHLTCWGDRQQIQTALTHLVENTRSNKNQTQQSKIAVNAFETMLEHTYTCIEVCDNGPGIPEEIQEKVFNAFFSTREDGTGLGLAIVKQLVENHGGYIEVDKNREYNCIMRLFFPYPLEAATP
ncbi:MAG: hypothetical protein CSB34_05615 [Desulfobulbus propionicus]|nr:MAG: hypothetical protein CSB34_05615 [Desulfobulbus propionicus]PIE63953.1 MAG: hypothetical protein CSA26_10455 [Desulfobacterales bacterium]